MNNADEMVRERIDAIKARCEEATPGPWQHISNTNNGRSLFSVAYEPRLTKIGEMYTSRDADFIAHAREDIPYLLGLIKTMTAQLAASKQETAAAVELIEEIGNDDTGDFDFVMWKIDKWRGPQQAGEER